MENMHTDVKEERVNILEKNSHQVPGYSKLIKSFGYGYRWKYVDKNTAEKAAKLK